MAVVSYVVTAAIVVIITAVAIGFVLSRSLNCTEMGQALTTVWIIVAGVCIVSVVAYSVTFRRRAPDVSGQNWFTIGYSAVILLSYVVFAFALMVLFNC